MKNLQTLPLMWEKAHGTRLDERQWQASIYLCHTRTEFPLRTYRSMTTTLSNLTIYRTIYILDNPVDPL